jgi:O-antigen/teichoic acid export membrane protein
MSLAHLPARLRALLLPGSATGLAGHRHERLRRAAWTGGMSGIATAVGLVVSFASIPLTVGYLGPERYGIWITISSLIAWIAITDMGLGSVALINTIAEARGRDDVAGIHSLVSTAFFTLATMALVLLAVFALAFPFVPWESVLNAGDAIGAVELRWAVAIAFTGFALLFPLGMTNAVYAGLQEGYIGQIWSAVGNLSTLAALIAVSFSKGGLPLLVLALTGVRSLLLVASMIYLFHHRHPAIRPTWSATSRTSLTRLFRLGWKYLIQQLANIGMFQSQPMLITQFLGSSAVGIYNIAYRIMSIPQILVNLFLMPLVPAYGEARSRGDWPWIWKTLTRSILLSVAVGVCASLPLIFLTGPVVRQWINPELVPSRALLVLLAAYIVCATAAAPAAVFFNGIERVGSMATVGMLNAALTIGLAMIFLPRLGLVGMGWAMLAGFAATNLVGQAWLVWQIRIEQKTGFSTNT